MEHTIWWTEWVERWNSTKDIPTGLGLLQSVFDAKVSEIYQPIREKDQRVLFLLELADDHDAAFTTNHSRLRDKAFRVLAENFFRNLRDDTMKNLSPDVAGKLLWFFMDGGVERYDNRKNVTWYDRFGSRTDAPQAKRAAQLATTFLQKFAEYHWISGWVGVNVKKGILELLYYHGALQVLLPAGTYKEHEWARFNDELLEKLRELALRDAPTIERGLIEGSDAARLWILATTAVKEIERHTEEKRLIAESAAIEARLVEVGADRGHRNS